MIANYSSHGQPYDQLLRLIERGREEELSQGDVALIRSAIQHVRDPEAMNSLLAQGFECEPFVEAAEEMIENTPGSWPISTLTRLVETLLFQGLDRKAATIADELRRRDPREAYAIRLWALSAGAPEATMRRFAAALPGARDPAAVIADAREFALRNSGGDLISIIDEAVARRDKTAGG